MGKAILIICDGLRNDTAARQMGFMEHLIESKRGTRYTARTTLPTVSKTSYETLHTGLDSIDHGITGNLVSRPSKVPNLFELSTRHGLTTAAAAYYWIFELYVGLPYDPVANSEHTNAATPIHHGIFYQSDNMPDDEVCARAANLVSRKQPDYMLVHLMGMDFAAHTHGSNSPEYRNQAIHQDQLLARYLPAWTAAGYTVVLTSDHGHTSDRQHGGTTDEVRNVPLYLMPPNGKGLGATGNTISQLSVAPTICDVLGVPIPESMTHSSIADSNRIAEGVESQQLVRQTG